MTSAAGASEIASPDASASASASAAPMVGASAGAGACAQKLQRASAKCG